MSILRLAKTLAPRRTEYQGTVIKGTVVAINSDPLSVDLDVRGSVIPGVRFSPAIQPVLGDVATCVRNDVDLLVQYFESNQTSGSDGGGGGGSSEYRLTTVRVNSTTTGAPASPAKVSNSGTATDVRLDFEVPEGKRGQQGDPGKDSTVPGPTGVVTTTGPLTYDADARSVGVNSLLHRLTAGEGPTPPTSGTWRLGDHYWNTAPTAAGTDCWVCVEAGTPGKWAAWQLLATS